MSKEVDELLESYRNLLRLSASPLLSDATRKKLKIVRFEIALEINKRMGVEPKPISIR